MKGTKVKDGGRRKLKKRRESQVWMNKGFEKLTNGELRNMKNELTLNDEL